MKKKTNEEQEFAQAMIVKPSASVNPSRTFRMDPLWQTSPGKAGVFDQKRIRPASSTGARLTKTKLPSPRRAEDPPETPNLEMVKLSKRQIESTVALIKKICADNEATPEIEVAFQPALDLMKQQLPDFYKQATNYFVTLERMQAKARQNMILSSAFVKGALTEFTKCWQFFSDTLERLYRIHPSPHAVRIEKSFKSIAHSFDSILKANEQRLHPSMNLKNAVWNIQELCNELIVNLVDMYSEPNFPHFDTDVLTMFKNDIRGFHKLINKAFRVEFQQCGLLRSDVMRIKSDVMVHVQEILNSLECAFLFPAEVAEAIKLKDAAEETLTAIFNQLSIPFFVVKPDPVLMQQHREQEQAALVNTPRDALESARVNEEEDTLEMDVRSKVKKFLGTCERLLKQNFTSERYDRSFETISTWIGESIVKTRELQQLIEKQKEQIEDMSNTARDKDTFYKTQSRTWSELSEQKENDRKTLENQLKSTVEQIAALKSDLVWAKEDQKHCQEVTEDVRQRLLETYQILKEESGGTECTSNKIVDILEGICRMARNIKKDVKIKTVIQEDKESADARKLLQEASQSDEKSLVLLARDLIERSKSAREKAEKIQSELEEVQETGKNQASKYEEDITRLRATIADLKGKIALKRQESKKSTEDLIQTQQISGSQSQDLAKELAEMKEKVQKLEEEKGKEEERVAAEIEAVRQKLGINCGYKPDEIPELDSMIVSIGNNDTPMQKQHEICSARSEMIEDQMRALFLRILGLKRLDSASQGQESFEGMSAAVYSVINSLQDERENLIAQLTFAKERASKFRTCFASLEQKLRAYITSDAPSSGEDDALIEKVFADVDEILSPRFQEAYMKISDIKTCFAALNVDMSASPKEYVPAFCRVFDELEKSMDTLKHFSKLLNALPDSPDDPSLSLTARSENIESLLQHMTILQKAMDAVPMLSTDQIIYNVLSKFVWLSKVLASHITLPKYRH